jgi:hypothetical protein
LPPTRRSLPLWRRTFDQETVPQRGWPGDAPVVAAPATLITLPRDKHLTMTRVRIASDVLEHGVANAASKLPDGNGIAWMSATSKHV